jgi:hypothetical protein
MSTDAVAVTDPNVKIPDAVKAAGARAEEAHKAMYEQKEAPNGDEVKGEGQGEAPPKQEPSNGERFTSEVQNGDYSKQQTQPPADEQSWEHRYKSMKGRYDRAEAQVRQLSERIASMESVIVSMQAAPPPAAQQSFNDAPSSSVKLLTPEEESDYGTEFLSVIGKKAREELLPEIQKRDNEIARLKSQLNGVGGYVEQSVKKSLEATLTDALPNWREVNTNPDFLSWLKLPDTYSGAIRHGLLKAAYERNDAPRVLAFFRGFLAEEAAVNPANRGPDIPNGATVRPKVSLDEYAAPGRAKTAAASSAPAEKPYFTRAEISKFYADSAAGRYRGKEAEKDRIEKQIFAAEREGRIK